MVIGKIELDRRTFDFVQHQLAINGHEAAAGYMAKMNADFISCFNSVTVSISSTGAKFTKEQLEELIRQINQGSE